MPSMVLVPHKIYRLARNMDEPRLRGKLVVFYEEKVFTTGDISRCRVRLLLDDGSDGEEWLVNRYYILPF